MLKKTIFNMVTGLLYTVLSTFTSILTTNIIINTLGSELNGIYQTTNQFVNFFSIIEGGYVLSAVVALYAPFNNKDYGRISVIYSTVNRYLKKTGVIFLAASTIAAGIYISFIHTDYSRHQMFLLFFLSALNLTAILTFQLGISVLFEATQTEYFIKLINIGVNCIMIACILFCYQKNIVDMVLFKGILFCGTVIGIVSIALLKRKRFPKVKLVQEYDNDAIQGSKDIFVQKIAATINQSLDMVLLTAVSLPVYSSVYSIYNMIFNFAKIVGDALCLAPFNGIGRIYSKGDQKETEETFELYETNLYFFYSAIFLAVAAISKAFIRLYIKDSQIYINNSILFLFAFMFYMNCMNKPGGAMINVSGNYRLQKRTLTISTCINLVLSLLLIRRYNIYGVLFATLLSYLFLIPFNIYYNSKYVVRRSSMISIKKMLTHTIVYVILLYGIIQLELPCSNYFQLFLQAAVSGISAIVIYILFELLLYGKTFKKNLQLIKIMIKGFRHETKVD